MGLKSFLRTSYPGSRLLPGPEPGLVVSVAVARPAEQAILVEGPVSPEPDIENWRE